MKKTMLLAALIAGFTVTALAQNSTKTIKVWGNCGMCEATIEKAAKIKGVEAADWNEDTKELKLTYNPGVTNPDAVQKAIAAVGYDTDAYRGDDKAYNNLHGCCQYDRKK